MGHSRGIKLKILNHWVLSVQVKVEEGYYRLKLIKGGGGARSLQEATPYQARSELASLASPQPHSRMDVGMSGEFKALHYNPYL